MNCKLIVYRLQNNRKVLIEMALFRWEETNKQNKLANAFHHHSPSLTSLIIDKIQYTVQNVIKKLGRRDKRYSATDCKIRKLENNARNKSQVPHRWEFYFSDIFFSFAQTTIESLSLLYLFLFFFIPRRWDFRRKRFRQEILAWGTSRVVKYSELYGTNLRYLQRIHYPVEYRARPNPSAFSCDYLNDVDAMRLYDITLECSSQVSPDVELLLQICNSYCSHILCDLFSPLQHFHFLKRKTRNKK